MYENGDHSYEVILFIVWYFDHGYEMPLIIGEKIDNRYELNWSCDHGWHIHVIMTVIMTPTSSTYLDKLAVPPPDVNDKKKLVEDSRNAPTPLLWWVTQ